MPDGFRALFLAALDEDLELGGLWLAALLLGAALRGTFAICCVIFWAVPKGHMPWRAVGPGAVFVTFASSVANWAFPFYLSNVSELSRFGSTLGFILIALLWFYLLSLALLAGAVINSLRHELHDTGELPYSRPAADGKDDSDCDCGGSR